MPLTIDDLPAAIRAAKSALRANLPITRRRFANSKATSCARSTRFGARMHTAAT